MDLWQDPSVGEQMRDYHHHHSKPMPPLKHMKEIKKVLQQIRKINLKLKGFERGFISEEGIKVRQDDWNSRRPLTVVLRRGNGTNTRALLRVFGSAMARPRYIFH